MPSDVPVPDIPELFRAAIDYSIGGLTCTNVYHVFSEGNDAATVADGFANTWNNSMDELISENVDWIQCRAQELVPNSLEAVESMTAVGTGSGTASGGAVPPGVACCIKLLTNFGGRRGRGRTFISGCPVSGQESNDSAWNTGLLADAQSAIDALIASCNGNGFPLVVFSRGHINQGGSDPVPDHDPMYNSVTQGVPVVRFTSQRRRNYN